MFKFNMGLGIRILIGSIVLQFLKIGITSKHAPSRSITEREAEDLRHMLQTVMKQNKKLALQNERLKQVWEGIKHMCTAVSECPCECSKTQTHSTNITEAYTQTISTITLTSSPTPTEFPLQILSINSSGSGIDPTKVSVNYTATPAHTTEWTGMRNSGALWRTAGRRCDVFADTSMFTSTVEVEKLSTMEKLIFHLYNEDEMLSLIFNLTELKRAQKQRKVVPTVRLFNVKPSYNAPLDGDLNFTTTFNQSLADLHDVVYIDGYFSGVNTTSSEILEVFTFNSDEIRIDQTQNSAMTITVGHKYAQLGGQLTLRYEQHMTGMLKEFYYGPLIKIFAPGKEDIFPNDTLGVFPLKEETLIYPPSTSLMCAAIGNPRPRISVFKIERDGKTKEMPTETVVADKFMTMEVLKLFTAGQGSIEGRYTCRTTSGNKTIDTTTDVIVHEMPVFDDIMTGVVQNDSEIIILSCKASGKPKPDLEFRLYGDYGPDLSNAGTFKVWRTDDNTSRATLTVPAADGPAIHTVFCTAKQRGQTAVSKKIEIFPGLDKGYNWDLYDRLGNKVIE